jgi:hypothetical protein
MVGRIEKGLKGRERMLACGMKFVILQLSPEIERLRTSARMVKRVIGPCGGYGHPFLKREISFPLGN